MTTINTESKQFKAAVEAYEFAESIGDIKYTNDYANETYKKMFDMAFWTMQDIAKNAGVEYAEVLAAVRAELAA